MEKVFKDLTSGNEHNQIVESLKTITNSSIWEETNEMIEEQEDALECISEYVEDVNYATGRVLYFNMMMIVEF